MTKRQRLTKHSSKQRRRLADMDMSRGRWPPNYNGKQRIGFRVLNPPLNGRLVETAYTDLDQATKIAVWGLNLMCEKQDIEPPEDWELLTVLLPHDQQ